MSRMLALTLGIVIAHHPAEAREPEQRSLWLGVRSGEFLPIAQIEECLLPQMKDHRYLGPEFDPEARTYRLKFVKAGAVIWIDVDARSGRIVARTSP